jgi:hypothetical protein
MLDEQGPAPQAAPVELPPGFALDQPSVAADVAKSGGIGLVKGAIGLAGLPGDAAGLLNRGIDYATDKLGLSDAASPKANYDLLGSGQIRHGVENVTGPLYEPKTTAGHYAQTVGEFALAALAGPGGIARKLITQAIVPGVASEAAGQATEGTAAEPYARVAGALAGGGVGPAAERIGAARAASKAVPTIEDVKAAASAGYKHPAVEAVEIKPQAVDLLSRGIAGDLNRQRLNDRLAPQTHALLEDLKTPVNGATHKIEDLETTRQRLGDLAGNFSNPVEQKAASQAIKALDNYSATIPQSHLLAGDANLANGILTEARANYASAKTAEKVAEKLRNADLQAGSTYSGGNLNNATRQKLRTLLTSKTQGRGLTSDELQTIEDTVRGSKVGNAFRAVGKIAGGGGGWGTLAAGWAGHMLAPGIGDVAVPAAGFAAKKVGDAMTRANAQKIVDQILARSPMGIANASRLPPAPSGLTAAQKMLLATAATVPARESTAPVDNSRQ